MAEHRCDHFKDHVGYAGQKYEVRYTDHDDVEHIFGWQNEPEGGLLEAVKIWPTAKSGRIVGVSPKDSSMEGK